MRATVLKSYQLNQNEPRCEIVRLPFFKIFYANKYLLNKNKSKQDDEDGLSTINETGKPQPF